MTTLWAFIVVIVVLVFIHELGHYVAARSVGVRVERFSILFPPRLITMTSIPDGWEFRLFFFRRNSEGKLVWGPVVERQVHRQGRKGSYTEYCLGMIPLGGYVKMAGVIDESFDTTIKHEPYELMSKPAWAQIYVMSAGVIMNIVLAYFLFTGVAWNLGLPEVSPEPVVSELVDGMPAQKAGLLPGDRIRTINGESITTWQEMSQKIHTIPNSPITVTWERDSLEYEKSFTTAFQVVLNEGKLDTLGAIGIFAMVEYRPIDFVEALQTGLSSTTRSFGMIISYLRMLVTGQASFKEIGGPGLIAQMAGEAAKAGWIYLFSLMALISVNLAFINILPIPGLDGGHILVILIELILRKKLSVKTRLVIQQIGMALLLLLFVTVIANDIGRWLGD